MRTKQFSNCVEGILERMRTRFVSSNSALAWLVAGVVFLVFRLVSSIYGGPTYLSDEIGYLGHAALLAGYTIDGASS